MVLDLTQNEDKIRLRVADYNEPLLLPTSVYTATLADNNNNVNKCVPIIATYILAQFGINYFTATEKYGEGAGTFQSWERNPPGEPRDGEVWHKKSGITPLVSMGGGLSYFVNPRFRIRAEVIANKPFSDELDGHKEWEDNEGVIHKTEAGDFYYTAALGATIIINDSKWKNEPKYARKAYTKLRKFRSTKSNGKRKKLPSRPQKRRR